jgi:2-keto-4-pentenoate hydratase
VTIDTQKIAEAFAQARQAGTELASYPGTSPASLAQAYDVQDRIVALMGGPIAGWKVGRINGAQVEQLGASRLAGPIFDDHIFYAESDALVSAPVYADGFVAAEAEFMMRVGRTPDPAKMAYSLDEAAAMIDDIRVGIEVASSPFPGINENGAAVTASDLGNSKALVIGAALDLARDSDFAAWPITVTVDGERVGEAMASGLPDGPYGAVRFLLEHLASRGTQLHAGQWISTGAITGVHKIAPGQHVVAQFGAHYTLDCTTHAAQMM